MPPPLSLQKEVDETLTTNVWLEQVSRDRRGKGTGTSATLPVPVLSPWVSQNQLWGGLVW